MGVSASRITRPNLAYLASVLRTMIVGSGDGLVVSTTQVAVDITNATDKAAPIATDELLIGDAAASGAIKKADAQSVVVGTTALLEGKQSKWIGAADMIAATTNGAATAQIESTTNKINYKVWDFDDATADEYVSFDIAMPKDWDLGTVTFQAFWTSANTGTEGVAWGLQAVAVGDGDAQDAAFGTAVVVTDLNQSSALDVLVTAESGAVTIAGTLAVDMLTQFRVLRDIDDPVDDMTEDARLVGIKLFYTTNKANDA